MLTVRKGYDVDYYVEATEKRLLRGSDAYYTDAVIAVSALAQLLQVAAPVA